VRRVSGFDFNAAVQMHNTLAVLAIAERFDRQWKQERFLFGKHGSDLPFGGAVNASVGPAFLPAVEIGLRFFQTLEAQTFQRRFLRVAHTRLDLAFAIWILDAARHGDRTVVGEHVTVERGCKC
jgi:hypothetical protein